MSEYVPIKIETLKSFADIARRMKGFEKELTTDEMISIFDTVQMVPSNAVLYYKGTAESVLNLSELNFESTAGGELSA